MKKILVYLLAFLFPFIGEGAIVLGYKMRHCIFYDCLFFILSFLITLPAMLWYYDYFDKRIKK